MHVFRLRIACLAILCGLVLFPSKPTFAAALGDLNGDGQRDLDDVRLTLQSVLKGKSSRLLPLADVSPIPGKEGRLAGDGRITREDAVRLLQNVMGLLPDVEFIPPLKAVVRRFDLSKIPGVPGSGHVTVFFPPDYFTGDRHYPIIYLLHGIGGSDARWEALGWLNRDSYESLILKDGMLPCLIVAPDGGNFPMWMDSVENPRLNYFTYLTKLLPAWAEGTDAEPGELRTLGAAAHRGIAGWSMGGFGTMHTVFLRPDLYRAAASHSGVLDLALWVKYFYPQFPQIVDFLGTPYSVSLNTGEMITLSTPYVQNSPVEMAKAPGLAARMAGTDLYLDVGVQDEYGLLAHTSNLDLALRAQKIPHLVEPFQGGHYDKMPLRLKVSLPWIAERITLAEPRP